MDKNPEKIFSVYCGRTYTLRELANKSFGNSWFTIAITEISERVSNSEFPCPFGRKSWEASSAKILFCEKYEHLLSGLEEYTNFVKKTDVKNRIYAPLISVISKRLIKGDGQHATAWNMLNWAHMRDPEAWPDDVPIDSEASEWSFCFNGIQLFINFSSSDHKYMKSRNLGPFLCLVINPRQNFDLVASADTKSGQLIRKKIRSRVAAYNGGLVPEELGQYGEAENREWKQYQLHEEGLPRPSRCPLKLFRRPQSLERNTK